MYVSIARQPVRITCRARYCFTISSVRPSVRPSRCGILSKRLHISSNLLLYQLL